jgi:hypothetical protein
MAEWKDALERWLKRTHTSKARPIIARAWASRSMMAFGEGQAAR